MTITPSGETNLNIETTVLSKIRRWWRPLTCIAIGASVFVHGVIVPMYLLLCKNQYFSDLTGLAALITSVAAAFAVREWGKVRGGD